MDLPLRQQFPDARAGNAVAAHIQHGHNLYAEAFLLSEFFQDFRVAGLAIAEAKIGPHMHGRCVQRVNQHAAHEFQGRLAGQFARKGQDHQQVDSRRCDQLHFALKRREEFGRVVGREKLDGMRLKGDGRGAASPARRATSTTRRSNVWCARWTPSKLPMVTTLGAHGSPSS